MYLNNKIKQDVENYYDVEAVNSYIANLKVKNATKRMYAYEYKKALESEQKLELVSKVQTYKQDSEAKQALTAKEVLLIKNNLTDQKEYFLFGVFVVSGVRLGEFFQIDFNQVKDEVVKLQTLKSQKPRYVCIPKEFTDIYQDHNFTFTRSSIRRVFERISKRFEGQINVKITPHILRHTCASLHAANGASLDMIAFYLGDEVKTVQKYYVSLNPTIMARFGKSIFWYGNGEEGLDFFKNNFFALLSKNEQLSEQKQVMQNQIQELVAERSNLLLTIKSLKSLLTQTN